MKVFNKTYLPESITYNGNEYTVNTSISSSMNISNTRPEKVVDAVKSTGKKAILVNVLSKNLKGKTDLYGKPYKPNQWIFTT